MKEKTLVVMAAGIGSRFGGLKQIEAVGPNGEFIMDYSIYDAKKAGFKKVVFVIKKELEEVFKETIGKRVKDKIKVGYAFQKIDDIPDKKYLAKKRNKPWGTVQAILAAKDEVEGDFVVINADDFYGYDSYLKAYEFLDKNTNDNTYACISYPYYVTSSKYGSVKRAVCYHEDGNIINLVESKITTMDGYALAEPLSKDKPFKIELKESVSMNMFAFKYSIFALLEDYFNWFFSQDDDIILDSEALLPNVIKENLLNHKIVLKNIVSDGKWLGITYKEDLEEVKEEINKLIKNKEYPSNLW